MIKHQTTLILGAGASLDLGFPLGMELKRRLKLECDEFLKSNHDPWQRLFAADEFRAHKAIIQGAAKLLSQALTTTKSVDDIVYRFSDQPMVVKFSKLLTAKIILESESGAAKRIEHGFNSIPFSFDTSTVKSQPYVSVTYSNTQFWLHTLLEQVVEGTTAASVGDGLKQSMGKLNVITFNYDRSFEFFFIEFIRRAFHLSVNDASDLAIATLKILHVYGSVDAKSLGKLHKQFGTKGGSGEFVAQILEASGSIQTIGEALADKSHLETAREWIASSDQLLFIGNSYIEQNVDILEVRPTQQRPMIYGTAPGLSQEYIERTKDRLQRKIGFKGCKLANEWSAWSMMSDIVGIL